MQILLTDIRSYWQMSNHTDKCYRQMLNLTNVTEMSNLTDKCCNRYREIWILVSRFFAVQVRGFRCVVVVILQTPAFHQYYLVLLWSFTTFQIMWHLVGSFLSNGTCDMNLLSETMFEWKGMFFVLLFWIHSKLACFLFMRRKLLSDYKNTSWICMSNISNKLIRLVLIMILLLLYPVVFFFFVTANWTFLTPILSKF